jgi:DNA-binding HxlR family transcriptional regulator
VYCKKSACPITKTAGLLSDTWTMVLLREFLSGPKRFTELETGLDGISTRTLATRLRTLEKDKLVKKRIDGTYVPTPRGKALRSILLAMGRYGKRYL